MDRIRDIESVNTFQDVSGELIKHLYSSKNIKTDNVELSTTSKEELKKLLVNCNFDLNKLGEILLIDGWSEDRISYFISRLDESKTDLLYSNLIEHSTKYGETLKEFNWLLKLIKGTDNLKTLSYPLMQLILSTVNSNQEETKHVFDLNKEMLCKLINALENTDVKQ